MGGMGTLVTFVHARGRQGKSQAMPVPSRTHPRGEAFVPAETHVEQGPMDRQAVFELIRDRLADILEIEAGSINEGDSFADDLDADSLALIELVEALEEELGERTVGFRIEDEDLEDLKTVRDAVDYVVARLG
jgi:acyl carrier protein